MYYGTGKQCIHPDGQNAQRFLARPGCGSRSPASCGSFVDVIFVARKQAPLSFLIVGEKSRGDCVVWVCSGTLSFVCREPRAARASPGHSENLHGERGTARLAMQCRCRCYGFEDHSGSEQGSEWWTVVIMFMLLLWSWTPPSRETLRTFS
jgi:hypothetical protein